MNERTDNLSNEVTAEMIKEIIRREIAGKPVKPSEDGELGSTKILYAVDERAKRKQIRR